MAVEFGDILEAEKRIAPIVTQTPLLESLSLNDRVGARLLVKAENLQKTGSFKIRGASNRIAALTPAERNAGVVAFSSGNHAQGVALAAKLFGVTATIVMPEDAPAAKIEGTRAYGAEVVLYDRYTQSREEIAAAIAAEKGAVLVPPFDNPFVIAGQGTAGLELARQADSLNAKIDIFVVCTSGGGLASGCGLALEQLSPTTKCYVAEPENFDDVTRSLEAGTWQTNQPGHKSICDALLLQTPGQITFPILKRLNYKGLVVSDDECRTAMRDAFHHLKIVVEPGGAAALAAILSGKLNVAGKTICVVTTGGNVDAALYRDVIAG